MVKYKPESTVQTEIMNKVKALDGYVIKVIKGNTPGITDLVMCVDGMFIGCEVKAEKYHANPDAQLSNWQKKHREMIKAAGGLHCCCASLEQFQDFLNNEVIL